jgi:hypothetical protein
VIEHLLFTSPTTIANMAVADDVKEKLLLIHSDVLIGAQSQWDNANSILDESEEDMQKEPREKKAYDRRDRRFQDAAEPRDLLCLAHTSRTPIDERSLVNAQKLQESSNAPMTEAVQALTKAANAMAGNAPAAGMTAEDMEALIDRKVSERMAAGTAAKIASDTPQAVKCSQTKNNGDPCGSYALKGTDACPAHTK